MNIRAFMGAVVAIIALPLLFAAPASAQATRTWVSGVGDDVNPCSRTAPCKTFAGAISKTMVGGEISVLDPGGFGAVTITKSISIVNDYTGEAGILASGTNGVTINCGSEPACIVNLRGLLIDGAPPGTPGLNGIRFLTGGVLHVQKCVIKNFVGAATNGNGIDVEPSANAVSITVEDTYITNNGASGGNANGGIVIKPSGSASVTLNVDHSWIENNQVGVRADGSSTTGTIRGVVRDTLVSGSAFNGVTAVAGTSPAVVLLVDGSNVSGNKFGLVVNGANATVLANQTSVVGNTTGLLQNGGTGALISYSNNAVNGNITTDGTFTSHATPE